ncbi:ParB/RepB/Spo0J family partition protein [Actinomyces sp. 2119]|uniref:ParB/RepB/Spo0J family partition protein n=1 Tax=Actinomyces sp. 2119 TaxID=2321393 RepID=UPI000E6CC763|nr:ParB/RepB/Spo0J family partition protein [Actinomyces sp. 2119]RJF44084.1 ParB/RepB/Spo0J family partition protein [Actinomyces sp. 2119]
MAQKRRGLGRGLQALIPDAQKETVSSSRPSDVFFPDSREDSFDLVEGSAAGNTHAITTEAADSARNESAQSKRDGSIVSKDDTDAGRPVKQTKPSEKESSEERRIPQSDRDIHGGSGADVPESGVSDDFPYVSRETSSVSRRHDVAAPTGDRRVSGKRSSRKSDREVSNDTSARDGRGRSGRQTTFAGKAHPSRAAADEGEELVPVPGATFAEIPVELIDPNPRQPRQVFDEEDISELAASITEVGLLQPIVVRRSASQGELEEERFELILGERRLRAAKEASLDNIPAVVRDTDDVDMLRNALLENLHRVQLNPLEEAAAYQQLLEDFGCTQAELSDRISISRSQISNTLRLMKLPPLVQRRLAAGVLSAGHARALLGLSHVDAMERMAQRVVAEGLSVRATEEMVALHEESDSSRQQSKSLRTRSTPLPALSTRLSDAFDTRVKVTKGAKKGRITIEFAGDEDLARIVSALAPGTSLDEE